MIHLTTYFDKNYLSRGLVLYDSLREFCNDFQLYILCLDDFTQNYFDERKEKYPNVVTLNLSDIENEFQELINAKANRSLIEYYFTLSPCLPLYLLNKYNIAHICSLDADILFCNNPSEIFKELEQHSIIITPHKFSQELIHLEKFGKYNVSFQIFKNDTVGLNCLNLWKKQCIEWCGDYFDENRNQFADQKYLDHWDKIFPNSVKVLDDEISGLAPWNINKYKIEKKDNFFYSNNKRLLFYHFHHFKIFNKSWATNGFNDYHVKNQNGVNQLYSFYWNQIENFNDILNINNDVSIRFDIVSNSLVKRILKEKKLYYRKNSVALYFDLKKIPKIFRKLYIKLYA